MANEYNNKVVLASGEVLIDLTGDTVDAQHVLSGQTFHDKSGATLEGECAFDSDTSSDTASVSEILVGKTAHARGALLTGTMPNIGSSILEISTKDAELVIPQGYHDGSGKAKILASEKSKIIPSNIRQGVTILGVLGTMSGSEGVIAQAKVATPNFTQQVITPSTGYTHLSQVTVEAITVNYSDNSAGGKTVTIGSV